MLPVAAWTVPLAMLACLPAYGQDAGALHRKLQKAMEAERWEKALPAALEIVKLDPTDATSHYNAGCVLARMGQPAAAVEALDHAAELGFSAAGTLRTDPDLESIRGLPGYAAVLKRVEETHAREMAVFKERMDRSRPLLYSPPVRTDGTDGADGGERRPLIVLLHGRGGRAENMARLFRPSAAKIGAVLVVPEAFEPYGNGFQWGDLDQAAYRVEHAIDFAAERYPIDRERVILAGFSQGAYISLASVTADPRRFAGVVALGACSTRDFALGEERIEDLPPIYIGVGSEDRAHDSCRPMARAYEAAGFEVKLRVYKGYGHVFPQNYEWELDRAFRFVLKAAPD